MPSRDSYAHGVPNWVDLMTPDTAGARAFYTELFGWSYEEVGDEVPYAMAKQSGNDAAGIGPLFEESATPSVWTTYFAVDSVDSTVEKVKANGGEVMTEAVDVTDAGRMAIVADPTGAVFGLWQANAHIGASVVNEHGAFSWNELVSTDLDTALGFYEAVFGHGRSEGQGPGGRYISLSVDERPVAGSMDPPVPGTPSHWGVYFSVDDVDAATERALAVGGSTTYGPMDLPEVGRVIGIADPYGAHFNLINFAGEAN